MNDQMPGDHRASAGRARWVRLAWLAVALIAVVAYWPGLGGDFWFDDNANIVRNAAVKIQSLRVSDLLQAWDSSLDPFPRSRPLAMLTFGVNHAVGGLDPFGFKLTNLLLHVVTGTLLFVTLSAMATQYLSLEGRGRADSASPQWWALFAAALWLLHPLQVSTVLYVVQRMTILATLAVLLGIYLYLLGRQRLVERRRSGYLLVIAAFACAPLGALAKETSLLLPLLLLVLEATLLRLRGLAGVPRRFVGGILLIAAVVPTVAAMAYLAAHPDLLNFTGRSFGLEERLLTQARVLWFYLGLVVIPDSALLGFYHDDFQASAGWLTPWTTLPAVLGLLGVVLAALVVRRRFPLFSFAVLFFLAGHLLESTVFPLELVFEHRNYLPSIAPLFALAYIPYSLCVSSRSRCVAASVSALVPLVLVLVTAGRVADWSNLGNLITTEVERHPESPRANYHYGQLLMSTVQDPELKTAALDLADEHFRKAAELSGNHLDGLFGLVLTDLTRGHSPDPVTIAELKDRLSRVPLSPLNVNFNQFVVLARWHLEPRAKLAPEDFLGIFNAALDNPTLPSVARASILNGLRVYSLKVLGDPREAIRYGELAMAAAPSDWDYVEVYVRMVEELGEEERARKVLDSPRVRRAQ